MKRRLFLTQIQKAFRCVNRDFLVIMALSIFAWGPLLTPAYFFQAHDAQHSIFYLVEFDQTLRDGYLWPRWAPDFSFGYGYPLFNIYAPLAIYAAEILHLLGLSFITAVKVMYVLSTVGAGLAMYLFVRRLLGRYAGLLAAVVYMVVPFHLVEIFVRSAYSEFVALALLPLALWVFTELVAAPGLRWIGLAGLVYGVLALTHHASFFAFTPWLVAYILYLLLRSWRSKGHRHALRAMLGTLAGGVLGLALAAIYLVPVLAEMRYVKVEQWTAYNYDYSQNFVYFSQLLSPYWGFGYSGPGLNDGMPFQLGAVVVVLVFFGGWLALTRRYAFRGTVLFFLVATLFVVWLMSPAAESAWRVLPIASLVQFPWRMLGLAALTMSVVAGSLLAVGVGFTGDPESENRSRGGSVALDPNVLILLLVVVFGSFSYLLPQYTPVEPWRQKPEAVIRWDRHSPADRVGMVTYTVEQPVTGPMEAQYLAGEPLQVATILEGVGEVETLRHGGASDVLLVRAEEPVTVQFYTYDYPGWRAAIDGQPVVHRHEPPYGLITVDVPAGEHEVSIWMGSTPPRLAGSVVTILAAVVIAVSQLGGHIWRRVFRLL